MGRITYSFFSYVVPDLFWSFIVICVIEGFYFILFFYFCILLLSLVPFSFTFLSLICHNIFFSPFSVTVSLSSSRCISLVISSMTYDRRFYFLAFVFSFYFYRHLSFICLSFICYNHFFFISLSLASLPLTFLPVILTSFPLSLSTLTFVSFSASNVQYFNENLQSVSVITSRLL